MDRRTLMVNSLDLFRRLENLCLSLECESSHINSTRVAESLKDAQKLLNDMKLEDG